MFAKETYMQRRALLKKNLGSGVLLFLGNDECGLNYEDNTFRYRQDSTFLYYFGLSCAGLSAIIDIDEDKEIYENMCQKMGPASPSLSGMPHTPGVRDKVGDLAADLADLDAGIKELEAEAERVLPAIEEFCVSISDPRMRLIFRLRFVRCRSWAEIAGTLGRYYTEAGVCKMAYNYLKKIA